MFFLLLTDIIIIIIIITRTMFMVLSSWYDVTIRRRRSCFSAVVCLLDLSPSYTLLPCYLSVDGRYHFHIVIPYHVIKTPVASNIWSAYSFCDTFPVHAILSILIKNQIAIYEFNNWMKYPLSRLLIFVYNLVACLTTRYSYAIRLFSPFLSFFAVFLLHLLSVHHTFHIRKWTLLATHLHSLQFIFVL